MNKYEIIQKIEKFAPPELAESWDCSGWGVETKKSEIKRVMLALTVTNDIIKQALEQNCDLIISHHPLFYVPTAWKNIDIYSAHTNLDRTNGGTTDTLVKSLGLEVSDINIHVTGKNSDVDINIDINEFSKKLSKISPNFRLVNNQNKKSLKRIAFCAGSGTDFIQEAYENGADALVTGDVKFHTALESPIILFDIGHFESEILVLDVFKSLLKDIETIKAKEKSPFIY